MRRGTTRWRARFDSDDMLNDGAGSSRRQSTATSLRASKAMRRATHPLHPRRRRQAKKEDVTVRGSSGKASPRSASPAPSKKGSRRRRRRAKAATPLCATRAARRPRRPRRTTLTCGSTQMWIPTMLKVNHHLVPLLVTSTSPSVISRSSASHQPVTTTFYLSSTHDSPGARRSTSRGGAGGRKGRARRQQPGKPGRRQGLGELSRPPRGEGQDG